MVDRKGTYQIYRETILGDTLHATLAELVAMSQLENTIAEQVMKIFDRVIERELKNLDRAQKVMLTGKLDEYKNCDDVWTFIIKDPKLTIDNNIIPSDMIKIISCPSDQVSSKHPKGRK
mmetsp:Transcript_24000/g.27182  ORF Transcript_24000/g.27182 Transcript_24000/m.27182 type:complete len:119 (-) Transcript_24000:313-669(-)